jgi:hypothetical protein
MYPYMIQCRLCGMSFLSLVQLRRRGLNVATTGLETGFRNICSENPIYSKLKRSDQSQNK